MKVSIKSEWLVSAELDQPLANPAESVGQVMKQCLYVYIYIERERDVFIYIYIYIHIYNPHLGLINPSH